MDVTFFFSVPGHRGPVRCHLQPTRATTSRAPPVASWGATPPLLQGREPLPRVPVRASRAGRHRTVPYSGRARGQPRLEGLVAGRAAPSAAVVGWSPLPFPAQHNSS
jgi:hypothetical protein